MKANSVSKKEYELYLINKSHKELLKRMKKKSSKKQMPKIMKKETEMKKMAMSKMKPRMKGKC